MKQKNTRAAMSDDKSLRAYATKIQKWVETAKQRAHREYYICATHHSND